MRLLVGPAFVAALIVSSSAASTEVHVVQRGLDITSRQDELADKVVALTQSASVESTDYAKPAERWDEALAQPIFVQALFVPARDMKLMGAHNQAYESTPVNEIRIVLSERGWADHILVRVGSRILAVTKYSPCEMAELIVASNLRTQTQEHAELLGGYCVENGWRK